MAPCHKHVEGAPLIHVEGAPVCRPVEGALVSSRCWRCSSMQLRLAVTELFLPFVSSLVHSCSTLHHETVLHMMYMYDVYDV